MKRIGAVGIALFAAGCGTPPAESVPEPLPVDALVASVETRTSTLRLERSVLILDGDRSRARAVRYENLPRGMHTMEVKLELSFACGLFDEERGRVAVHDSRSFDLQDPSARLVVWAEERSVTHPPDERLSVLWRLDGRRASWAEGCAFSPEVAITGCDLPAGYSWSGEPSPLDDELPPWIRPGR